MNSVYKIGVREMVEFLCRSGDIDNRIESQADPDALTEGVAAHKRIQESMPDGYKPEQTIKLEVIDKDITIQLEGRADGIWQREEEEFPEYTIDEIKSTYTLIRYITKPKEVHMAQAKCYAYMYAAKQGLDRIGVQMTYTNIPGGEVVRFMYDYKTEDLKLWFDGIIAEFIKWEHMQHEYMIARQDSITAMEFPYEYRPGQKDVAINTLKAIRIGSHFFVQAPTGIGKTLAVLYPALKALGEGLGGAIFYLTAKTVTGTVARDTLTTLGDRGLVLKSVSITAKEKACANETFECNPDMCAYAEGHYDRINDAVFDIITHEQVISREKIDEYAKKHRVCPYEYSLDISNWCDLIIGDYNYAFDPRAKLKRYFGGEPGKENIFLVDEAHNLISRACEMYSAVIIKEDVLKTKLLTKGMDKYLTKILTKLNTELLNLKRMSSPQGTQLYDIKILAELVSSTFEKMSWFLKDNKSFYQREEVVDFYFRLEDFLDAYSYTKKGYKIYSRLQDDGSFMVKILCIDPSERIKECLDYARSAIFFSATLLPINYYKELITGSTEEYAMYVNSPFDIENRLLRVGRDVSSRYKRRTASEFMRMAEYIITTVEAKRGNYMAFFPSYAYMNQIEAILKERLGNDKHIEIIAQNSHMSETQRQEFLDMFDYDRGNDTLIGLCVMGGMFAEGIDLTGEKLIGAIIIGTGLSMINFESELAKEYFEDSGKDGFDYAYRYPGMNKVMQAAGRVIRTDDDRGIILLLDERFTYSENKTLFPKEWYDCQTVTIETLPAQLNAFWEYHN